MAAAPITPAGVPPQFNMNQDILAGSEIRTVTMGTQDVPTGSGFSFGLGGNAVRLNPLTETTLLTKLNEPPGGDKSTMTEEEQEDMKISVNNKFNGNFNDAQAYARNFLAGESKIPSPTKTNVTTTLGGEGHPIGGGVPLGRPDTTIPTLASMAVGMKIPNDARSPSEKALGSNIARSNSANLLGQGAANA